MQEEYKYKQGDYVAYTMPPKQPWFYLKNDELDKSERLGIVSGVAASGVPGIGPTYILKDNSGKYPNDEYFYTYFVVPELYLRPIDMIALEKKLFV